MGWWNSQAFTEPHTGESVFQNLGRGNTRPVGKSALLTAHTYLPDRQRKSISLNTACFTCFTDGPKATNMSEWGDRKATSLSSHSPKRGHVEWDVLEVLAEMIYKELILGLNECLKSNLGRAKVRNTKQWYPMICRIFKKVNITTSPSLCSWPPVTHKMPRRKWKRA